MIALWGLLLSLRKEKFMKLNCEQAVFKKDLIFQLDFIKISTPIIRLHDDFQAVMILNQISSSNRYQ